MTQSNASILIEPGQPAPQVTLPDQHGQTHSLSDYRGKWVVLYFYPKDDTPGCTQQACQFRDHMPELEKLNAVVLGISPDDSQSHAKFSSKYELPFTLLADEGAHVSQQYGVWQEKNMYGRKYMGVSRTTYLIDPQGQIAKRWDKVKVEGHHEDVAAAIQELAR